MKKERILKKDWPEFLKAFNAEHQFRPVRVSAGGEEICHGVPFMGLVFEADKKEVILLVGGVDLTDPAHLVHTLVSPRALYVCREGDKVLGIEVHSARAPKLVVEFLGEPEEAQKARQALIAKIAYEIYLQRGGEHGKDLEDWLQAEALVQKAAQKPL